MTEIKQISAHSENINKVINALGTSIEKGLSEAEAQARLEKYGKNELIKEKGKTALQIFIGQFKSFLVYLLLFDCSYLNCQCRFGVLSGISSRKIDGKFKKTCPPFC